MNDRKPSKSEKKRQFLALQELGEQLIALSEEQINSIDTDEYLQEQVLEAKRMKSHGALRRQKQLIGKIMRQVDAAPIEEALERFGRSDRVDKQHFAAAEAWRDRILSEGRPAVDEFLSTTGNPDNDLYELQQQCAAAPSADKRRHIARQLFRKIHQIVVADVQNAATKL